MKSFTFLTLTTVCIFQLFQAGCSSSSPSAVGKPDAPAKNTMADWILFSSDSKIGVIQPDGAGEQFLDFPEKKQRLWQGGLAMPDHRRLVFRSQEPPIDPKASFYDKTGAKYARSHLWLYDFFSRDLREIPVPTLMAAVAVMPDQKRFLLVGEEDPDNPKTRVYSVNFDGADKQNFHELSGFAYCFNLSPDGKNVAYNHASEGYKIYVLNLETGKQTLLAGDSEYLNFGPEWSPDGQWILFQRCLHKNDPMHERSDLCVVRPDGSELRVLTTGQRQWFGTSYGPADSHGGGSNFPHWSPDGKWITFTRCSPDAQTAWVFRKDRPDTDHFNCDYAPDQARGGSQICLIDAKTGVIRDVTSPQEKLWVWRAGWSPDSSQIVYARAAVGERAQLWIINADGSNPRLLTRGFQNKGADFPKWVQLRNPQP